MTTPQIYVQSRIPAIDSLRVFAILVLVFYHHFIVYVPEWEFHYKIETNWVWLQHIMILTSPWRMGLLWLISGIALSFMLAKMTTVQALVKRSSQLLFPLLVGVLFIVPPQLYVEMTQAGEMPLNYPDFVYALFFEQGTLFTHFTAGIWPSIDVNHLWYLRSLWQFTLLAIVLFPIVTTSRIAALLNTLSGKTLYLLGLIFLLVLAIHYTQTGNNIREYYGCLWFFTGLLFGRFHSFWHQVKHYAKPLAVLVLISQISLQLAYAFVWKDENTPEFLRVFAEMLYIFNRTIMPIAILAIVYKWFNHRNVEIERFNVLVFPLYIVHQTISVVVTFLLSLYAPSLTLIQHFVLSTFIALSLCACALSVINTLTLLHPMFGISITGHSDEFNQKLSIVLLCFSAPMAFEILF